MRRRSHLLKLAVLFLVLTFIHVNVFAASSEGCSKFSSFYRDNLYNFATYNGTGTFAAGDVISWNLSVNPASTSYYVVVRITLVSSGSRIIDTFITSGVVSDSGSITIPASGSYSVVITAQDNNLVFYSADASCSPAPFVSPSVEDEEEQETSPSPVPPDNRINWGYGDLETVLFPASDGVQVYCYSDGEGSLIGIINQALVDNAPDQAQDVPVLAFSNETCRFAFYILDSGEFQINVWTTDGKLYEIIADNINFTNASKREV